MATLRFDAMMRTGAAPLVLGLLLLACSSSVTTGGAGDAGSGGSAGASGGAGAPVCEDPPSPGEFELGGGEKCFERLAEMQVVPVMQGPQGGFHLWLAMGCKDCEGKEIVRYGLKDPKTNDYFPDTKPLKVLAPFSTSGWPQKAGFSNFLPGVVYDETTQLPKGTHVIMMGEVLDSAGAVVHSKEIEVELGDIEIWSPPCSTEPTCGSKAGPPCCEL
jgi:hypothetical protein